MPIQKIQGLDTYYEIHGEGETIVLLHNGFSCTKMWEDIYPILLEAGYRVVTYDRRGYGQSDGGPDFEEFYTGDDFRVLCVTAMAELLKTLDIDRFHIVGQCEGGVVGVDYFLQYPEQVKTLTTASTQCFSKMTMEELNSRKFPHNFQGLSPELKKKYVCWHGADRAEYFYFHATRYGGSYGRKVFDLRGLLPSITCPTLVMYPDRGGLFEVEQGMAIYRGLPNGELAVFPRCGHNMHEHYTELYAMQVLKFIERCSK